MMRIVAIVQARMGSHRLPGKVLQDIAGVSMLARVVQRLRKVPDLDQIVVATTDQIVDDPVVAACSALNCDVFRGSEQDVLDRFYQCALHYQADIVVRVTADCPLLAADVVSTIIQAFLKDRPDYASNCLTRTYPRGLDCEIMSMEALKTAWTQASETYQREHVTPYIYQHPELFDLLPVVSTHDYSHYRWTVDEEADLEMVRLIYRNFEDHPDFSWLDVIELLSQKPEIALLNQKIQQKVLPGS